MGRCFPDGKLSLIAEALDLYAARVDIFLDTTLARNETNEAKVKALFAAFARRIEDAEFASSCAIGAVTLDLDPATQKFMQPLLADVLERWTRRIAFHLDLGEAKRTRSFASLVLTAVEGAYIRSRAERSKRPFVEAGEWLARAVAE